MQPSFYVYLHRTRAGRPFYVGKGQGRRAWSTRNRNIGWRRLVAREGLAVEVLFDGLQEWFAVELEIETIARIGRENLLNLTDGGEGVSGRKISEETRAKLREAKLGKCFSDEHRANLSKAKRGVAKPPRSADHCAKLREANRGRAIACSNGLVFAKLTQAERWLRLNGYPRASIGGLHTAAKRNAPAYGFSWKFLGI